MGLGTKKKKTKGQALRAVLYVLWEHDNKGIEDFEKFYEIRMDQLIEFVKAKLPDEQG